MASTPDKEEMITASDGDDIVDPLGPAEPPEFYGEEDE